MTTDHLCLFIETPLEPRDYQRFGVATMIAKGFRVSVLDMTAVINPGYKAGYERNITDKNVEQFIARSKKDIADYLMKNKGLFGLLFFSARKDTMFFFRLMRKTNVNYAAVWVGNVPLPKRAAGSWGGAILFSLARKLKALAINRCLPIQHPSIIFVDGRDYRLRGLYPGRGTRVINIHTFDYDLYLEHIARSQGASAQQDHILFLDNYLPFHPDFQLSGSAQPDISPERYYGRLNAFFSYLEAKLGLPVVIAAHPRARKENYSGYFNGRKVEYGKTIELVAAAKAVLAHASTSINFAVLFRKPIIFITSDQIGGTAHGKCIDLFADQFDQQAINLDHDYELSPGEATKIDDVLYEKYQNNYIKLPDTQKKYFWEIAIEHINETPLERSEDPLRKRYIYKLAANFFGMLLGLVTAGIVPRALGPQFYGNYNFLTNFFTQIVNFLDMGTSTAYFTKLAQRPKDQGLVSFYFIFTALVSVAILTFISFSLITGVSRVVWPGQAGLFICLAAGWGILNWLVEIFNKTNDAYGLTVPAERTKLLVGVLRVTLVALVFIAGWMGMRNYFFLQYLMFFLLIFVFSRIIRHSGRSIWAGRAEAIKKTRQYLKEFYQYSHPLFVSALVIMLVGILDRWLLQVFGGGVQQGFYGLSYLIGSFCFVFTGAMTPLFMRELSIAHGLQDRRQMAELFRRYIPLFYSLVAYFSCFVALQSTRVVQIFGGRSYSAAFVPVAIMAFYPIHQTYGQLGSSVLMATGQTKLYRNISIFITLIGIPITYLLIAPASLGGLGVGATGLAIKMVFLQIIAVNIQLFFSTRYLQISFWKYAGHQLISVLSLLLLAVLSGLLVDRLLGLEKNLVFGFLLSGFVYSVLAGAVFYYFPVLAGLKQGEIRSVLGKLIGRLKEATDVG